MHFQGRKDKTDGNKSEKISGRNRKTTSVKPKPVQKCVVIETENSQSDLEMDCEGVIEADYCNPAEDPDIIKLSKELDNTDNSLESIDTEDVSKLSVFNITKKSEEIPSPVENIAAIVEKNEVESSSVQESGNNASVQDNSNEMIKNALIIPNSMPCFPTFEKCSSKFDNAMQGKDLKLVETVLPTKNKNYEILTDMLDDRSNLHTATPYILSVPTIQNSVIQPKQEPYTQATANKSSSGRRRNKDGKRSGKMCHRYTREERDEIAEYAMKHGLTKSADHFNKLWNMKLTPSTIFYFRKTYLRDKKAEEIVKIESEEGKGDNSDISSVQNPMKGPSPQKRPNSYPTRKRVKPKVDEAEKILQEMELKQKILKICSMGKTSDSDTGNESSSDLKGNSGIMQHDLNSSMNSSHGDDFLVYNTQAVNSVWAGDGNNFSAAEIVFPNNHMVHPTLMIPLQKGIDSAVHERALNNNEGMENLENGGMEMHSDRNKEIVIEGLKSQELPVTTDSLPSNNHQNGTNHSSPTRVSRRKNTPRKALATHSTIEMKDFTKAEEEEIAKYAMDHSLQDTATFFQILWNVQLDTETVKMFKDGYLQYISQENAELLDDDSQSSFTYVL